MCFWIMVMKEELKIFMLNQENIKSNMRWVVNVFEKQGEKRVENVFEFCVVKEKKRWSGIFDEIGLFDLMQY